jgi:hypothetical protein
MTDPYRTTILALLLSLLVSVPATAQQQRIENFSLGYKGVPLKYERVFQYEHPYPDAKGFLVQTAEASDPAIKAGLRIGNIITHVDSQPVQTREQIRSIIVDNFGETLTFRVQKKTPRYEHRLRQNPFYDRKTGNLYMVDRFELSYDTPGLQRNPVVSGPTNELYHKKHFDHSPDTETNTIYMNPPRAVEAGLSPCPVCFPSGKSGTLENLLQKQVVQSKNLVGSLTQGDRKIEDVPESLRSMVKNLEPHLLRTELEPTIELFQADQMYGFGLPSGEIILTYNLFQYAELTDLQAAFVAHPLAHADRQHDHKPVEQNRLRQLVERAVRRTTGFDFKFNQLKEWAPAIP